MLTESEKCWLEQSDKPYCSWCIGGNDDVWCDYALATDVCPLYENMDSLRDAAEFEARVAAKLADPECTLLMPPMYRLMFARLQVEEEIDAD